MEESSSQAIKQAAQGFAKPANGKVHCTSIASPPNLDLGRDLGKKQAARLIPSSPFAGAAEQVGRTGQCKVASFQDGGGWPYQMGKVDKQKGLSGEKQMHDPSSCPFSTDFV
ncbi:hypothetical protein DHEL01_v202928 [Diaporthe helianthi]|uniref:Uncharacterized protein n=1 Tax=Diaporthe helianthi TaxID=158607 RepID=A0A2P5I893_DIAHE|nr:hypothetical protein DHEL01_v202928 [Diaporthe helianthi]